MELTSSLPIKLALSFPCYGILACFAALFTLSDAKAQTRITGEGDPLFTLPQGGAWSALARARVGTREFKADGELLEADLLNFNARLGVRALHFLSPWVELGSSKAERNDFDGETGIDWAVGVYGNFFEYVITENDAMPGKEVVRLGGEASYRQSESNFADGDFDWTEIRIAPRITYELDNRDEASVMRLRPEGTAVHGALVFSTIDGDFADADVEENRNFGVEIGVGFRWSKGFVTEISGLLLGDKDRMLNFGMGVHF